MNSTGGAANHTNRVHAVHAGIGHHVMVVSTTVAVKTRVVVMGSGASCNTFVTTDAAVHINQHGRRAVYVPILHEEFQHARIDSLNCRLSLFPRFVQLGTAEIQLAVLRQIPLA